MTTPRLEAHSVLVADGLRLPLQGWMPEGPPRATLLALHGLTSHAGTFMTGSAPLLREGGLHILAYDQRGHGRNPHRGIWPGTDALVSDAVTAIRLLRAAHPDRPFYVIGESLGANVALLAADALQAAGEGQLVSGWILAAPGLFTLDDMSPTVAATFSFLLRTAPTIGAASGLPSLVTTDNQDALDRIAADPLTVRDMRIDLLAGMLAMHGVSRPVVARCCATPTLFLYGAQDRVIERAPTAAVLGRLPPGGGGRVALYADGWHTLLRDLNRAVVTDDILAFAADPHAPLPSGAEAEGARWVARGGR